MSVVKIAIRFVFGPRNFLRFRLLPISALRYDALFFCTLLLCAPLAPLFAQTGDQFRTSQSVITTDTTAPSVPGGLIANAVSTDQIDISWNASTDDVAVTGYQIFRDNVQIATTTLLSYSDTGLIAETAYSYNVTAFDAAGNISGRSATTTETTQSPFVPTAGGGNAPQYAVPRLSDLLVRAEEYSASISWETSIPTRSRVEWGKSEDYELGTLLERSLLSEHATRLTGLVPGTGYYFRITGIDRSGRETVLAEDSFVTRSLPDDEPPENVSNLVGFPERDDAVLSWTNPWDTDFDHVRIVRRADGYPVDPADGVVVYEGGGISFRDRDVFLKGNRAYYGVFAYDKNQNVSSGAVVLVTLPGEVVPPPTEVELPPGALPPLKFRDIIFVQDGKEISYIGNEVTLQGESPFELRIPYESLPEHLKTILVTLKKGQGDGAGSFSFLLRVNKEKTLYSAKIGALSDAGEYPITVMLLDYKQQSLSRAEGKLVVEVAGTSGEAEGQRTGLFGQMLNAINLWILVLLLLLLLLILFILLKMRSRSRSRL